MSALIYIIVKSLKNSLLDIIRKPGKLALWLAMIAVIVGIIVLSLSNKPLGTEILELFWLKAVIFAFITLFFVLSLRQGLSRGDAIFEMQDVNLIFVAPINPQKILLYGIARMARTAFLASIFILFQANTLALFDIDWRGMFVLFACFVLAVVVMTATSLLVYTLCNSRPTRKRVVKLIALAVFVPLVVYAVWQYISGADVLAAMQAAIDSATLNLIPVVGWTTAAVASFFTGNVVLGMAYLGTNLALLVGIIVYLQLSNPDYYEDVLVATETAFEKRRAVLEGDINAAMAPKQGKAVKLKRTGIRGFGASAIFGRHIRESFRTNRLGFVSLVNLGFIGVAIAICYFVRDLSIVLQIMMWFQVFLIGTGRGLKELFTHYIYMLPLPAFKKLVWNNMETMAQVLLVSCTTFVVGGLLIGANMLVALACILVFVFFSFALLALNYLSMRLTGTNVSQGLMMMLYMIAVIVLIAPGLAVAMLVGFAIGSTAGLLVGLLLLAAWELFVAAMCFVFARGILHNCDMPSMKMGG